MRRCDDPAANRGRESGAYLEHIVANYDDGLAEWTVFSQAHEPTPGYQDGETSHTKEGGHLLRGSSFDDYVLAAANADAAPFYQPVSSMVNISDPRNYRHNVRGSFLAEHDDVVARRDEWGAVACPDPARGARARARGRARAAQKKTVSSGGSTCALTTRKSLRGARARRAHGARREHGRRVLPRTCAARRRARACCPSPARRAAQRGARQAQGVLRGAARRGRGR